MAQSNFDPDFALAKDLSDLKARLARLEQQTVATTVDPGGLTGKPLVKVSDKDFDTAWQTLGVDGGGTGLTTATGYLKGAGSTVSAVATPIPVGDGGTGQSTLTSNAYLKGNATSGILSSSTTVPVADGGVLTGGTSGQLLSKNSNTTYDLAWESVPISQNFLINGGFDIWQRGTSSTTNGVYIADRWLHSRSAGTHTVSRSTDVPVNTLPYSLSFASTSGTAPFIQQRIESTNALLLAGQTVTVSVWAKSTVGTGNLSLQTGYPTTTTDTFSATTVDQSLTLAASMTVGTWTRYSATFTVNENAVRGYFVLFYRNVTTTSTTTLYAGAQLELGSAVTDFRRNAPSIQSELAACQRYYTSLTTSESGIGLFVGFAYLTTNALLTPQFPVAMRTAPVLVLSSASHFGTSSAVGAGITPTAIALAGASTITCRINITVSSGYTAGQATFLQTSSTSAVLAFNSEL